MFAEAAPRLDSAAKQIDDRLAKVPDPAKTPQDKAARAALTRAKLQAEFEQGMNLLDQARAFDTIDDSDNFTKSLEKARDILRNAANRDDSSPLAWQARAWLGRTYQVETKNDDAKKEYEKILTSSAPAADSGKRLAACFRLLMINTDPNDKKTMAEIQKRGEDWLARYPSHADSAEGLSVRYKLADAYLAQAETLRGKKDTPPGNALALYAGRETVQGADGRGERSPAGGTGKVGRHHRAHGGGAVRGQHRRLSNF